MTTADAARDWIDREFLPVPIPFRMKKPTIKNWPALRIGKADVARYFNGAPQNVGVILGDPHADVDLDCPEAIAAAATLAPETGLKFGRASKPGSHRLFRSDPPMPSKLYKDPTDERCLCELRCLKKDGSIGFQTVVPNSTHEGGEAIRFEPGFDGTPANIDGRVLAVAVARIAAAALLARHWPAAGHGRHQCELALAGCLVRGGWQLDDVEKFVVATYRAVPDHDPTKFARVREAVRSTWAKRDGNNPMVAFTTLSKAVGEVVAKCATAWLETKVEHVLVVSDGAPKVDGPPPVPMTLEEVIKVFSTWLHLPDPGPVKTVLAAAAANRMKGDPLWMFLVGPPASGKTEILDSLLSLPHMHPAGTLTEASLLSGVPGRDRAKDASGGLLRAIGDFGFIVCKDFTSVLSMNRELRAGLLAALREIYDGAWTRHVGADGGRTLSWRGKVALIGGVTPVIDAHHAVMAAMGERFLLCRLPDVKPKDQALSALRHVGKEQTMRKDLRQAVSRLFAGLHVSPPFALSDEAKEKLAALATVVARCRSAVERDSYKREIELVPGSERPARLVLALARLYSGMRNIGVSEGDCWPLLCRVGMDCIPAIRRSGLDFLRKSGKTSTPDVATGIGYPTSTVRRSLEDLTVHGILRRQKNGVADDWELTQEASEWLEAAAVPEMSGDQRTVAGSVP